MKRIFNLFAISMCVLCVFAFVGCKSPEPELPKCSAPVFIMSGSETPLANNDNVSTSTSGFKVISETEDCTIYYTVDGTDPTTLISRAKLPAITNGSGANPLSVSRFYFDDEGVKTLKAIAVKEGLANSDVTTITVNYTHNKI